MTVRMTRGGARCVALCAGLVVALAGCADEGSDTSTTSTTDSSGSASASEAAEDERAYDDAEKAIKAKDEHDFNKPIPADADWADSTYRKSVKDLIEDEDEKKVTRKGTIKTASVHPETSDRDAPGGWDLSVIACSTSTVRIYDAKGNDVTADPETPGEKLPKGPRQGAHRVSFTTPDDGKTWQIHQVQQLTEEEAKETPCDVS